MLTQNTLCLKQPVHVMIKSTSAIRTAYCITDNYTTFFKL